MSIDKLNIRFNEPIYDQENIEKLKDKVNEIVDGTFDEDGKIDSDKLDKYLYCHPISIYQDSGDNKYIVSCLIFNNNSTPFTFQTFQTYVNNLQTVVGEGLRIICTGIYKHGEDDAYILSYLYKGASVVALSGGTVSGTIGSVSASDWVTLFGTPSQFTDGVNQIY